MENSNNMVCVISLFFYTAAELQFAVPALFFFHAARPKAALVHGYLLALQVWNSMFCKNIHSNMDFLAFCGLHHLEEMHPAPSMCTSYGHFIHTGDGAWNIPGCAWTKSPWGVNLWVLLVSLLGATLTLNIWMPPEGAVCPSAPGHTVRQPLLPLLVCHQLAAKLYPWCQTLIIPNERNACTGNKKTNKIKIFHESQQPRAGIALPGVWVSPGTRHQPLALLSSTRSRCVLRAAGPWRMGRALVWTPVFGLPAVWLCWPRCILQGRGAQICCLHLLQCSAASNMC